MHVTAQAPRSIVILFYLWSFLIVKVLLPLIRVRVWTMGCHPCVYL